MYGLTPSSAAPNGRTTQMACEWKGRTVVIDNALRLGVSCSVLFAVFLGMKEIVLGRLVNQDASNNAYH